MQVVSSIVLFLFAHLLTLLMAPFDAMLYVNGGSPEAVANPTTWYETWIPAKPGNLSRIKGWFALSLLRAVCCVAGWLLACLDFHQQMSYVFTLRQAPPC